MISAPYFVCIGAEKSATTWLFERLKSHSEIYLTPHKEIHYFDSVDSDKILAKYVRTRLRTLRDILDRRYDHPQFRKIDFDLLEWYGRFALTREINDDWYVSLFEGAQEGQMWGDITPTYYTLGRGSFEHMKRLAPHAKIIFLMREPVDRSWSAFRFSLRNRDISLEDMSEKEIERELFRIRNTRFSHYTDAVRHLAAEFAPENVFLGFYDEVNAGPEAFIDRVTDFLGLARLSPSPGSAEEKSNVSQVQAKMPEELAVKLHNYYSPMVRELSELIDLPPAWIERYGLGAQTGYQESSVA